MNTLLAYCVRCKFTIMICFSLWIDVSHQNQFNVITCEVDIHDNYTRDIHTFFYSKNNWHLYITQKKNINWLNITCTFEYNSYEPNYELGFYHWKYYFCGLGEIVDKKCTWEIKNLHIWCDIHALYMYILWFNHVNFFFFIGKLNDF